jgi:hypothetical protein
MQQHARRRFFDLARLAEAPIAVEAIPRTLLLLSSNLSPCAPRRTS